MDADSGVLDNLAPLRQASPSLLVQDAHLFTTPAAVRSGPGVTISWFTKKVPTTARLEILDSAGTVLRTFVPDTTTKTVSTKTDSASIVAATADSIKADSIKALQIEEPRFGSPFLPNKAGLNWLRWDLRAQGIRRFTKMILWGGGTDGPVAPPGRYTARLTLDGRALNTPLVVRRNPRITDVTDADLRAQYAFSKKVRDKADEANQAVIAIRRVKAQLADREKRSADAALKSAGATLRLNAAAVEESIYQVRNQSNQDPLNFPIKVNNRLATLLSMAEAGDGPPTNNMPEILGILSAELKGYTDRLARVWSTELAAVNKELARLSLIPLDPQCEKIAEQCSLVP